ncbi:MAG TPA: heme-binding domain-containing protein [Pyrinomonadaceae bacterium]|jgi:hypothetical protein
MKVPKLKVLKWTIVVLAVIFFAAQVVRPSRTNPPVDQSRTMHANLRVTPEVDAILERSCNDCHSNNTRWPWYSEVSPVSWWLVNHVEDGRRHLSFSEWGTYPPKRAAHKLQEICEEVEQGKMPFKSYVSLHPSARLSDSDKKVLCDWANGERTRLIANNPGLAQ